jgi:hypothetical protein
MYRRSLIVSAALLVCCWFGMTVSTARCSADEWNGTWVHYERQAPSKDILSMFVLPDGRIAAGCADSFHLFDQGRWKKYVFDPSLLSNHAPFYCDSTGKLYFLDNTTLVVWNNGVITRHDSVHLYGTLSMAQDSGGTIYFGSFSGDVNERGIFSSDGVSLVKIFDGRVRSLAMDASGTLWATFIPVGGNTLHLMSRTSGGWNDRTGEIASISPFNDTDLVVQTAPDGSVWVTNVGWYGVYRNGAWTFVRNLNEAGPVALMFDRSGRVWGYSTRTLYLHGSGGNWTLSKTYQNLLLEYPGFICVGPDSSVYTFDTSVVYRYDGKTWNPLDDPYDLGSNKVTCMAYLGDGRLVCGHGIRGTPFEMRDNNGLSVFDGREWRNFKTDSDNANFSNVYVLKSTQAGDIIVYSDDGYYRYDGKYFDHLDSLRVFDTNKIVSDADGSLWLSTGLGLVQYNDPNIKIYRTPADMNLYGGVINLCMDDLGNFYMQAIRGNVLYTDRATWYTWIPDTGHTISDIAVQGNGTVWGARITDLSWWNISDREWEVAVDFVDSNRVVEIDPLGRIWASAYGKTGYLENGEFHSFPALSKTASNAITFSDDGRIVLNAFDRDRFEQYGLYQYFPKTSVVSAPSRPSPMITAEVVPNPFNLSTVIRFTIPSAERTRVEVFNITGQRVAVLADGIFPAGENHVTWNARSDAGSPMSTGVYLYRIESGRNVRTGKLLLLK